MAFLEKVNLGVETLGLVAEPKVPPTPFVFARGVEAIWPSVNRPVSIDRLLNDVQKNHLTTRDLNIAETLFRHRYLTGFHLNELFFKGQNKKLIQQKLEKLTNLRLIQQFGWKINEKPAKTKVYCLDIGGAMLLEAFRKRDLHNWSLRDNLKAMPYIFRLLMANEVYVKLIQMTRLLGEEEGLAEYLIEPTLKISENKRHEVHPTAKFSFQRKSKTVDFLLEVLRESDIEYIPEKLRKFNDWYLAKNLKVPPVLLIVTEKESQALRIGEIIAALGLSELAKWSRFSTDLRIMSEPFHRTFFKLVNGAVEVTSSKIFHIGDE